MKCIRNTRTDEIRRVPDRIAFIEAAYGWSYCSKQEWKASLKAHAPVAPPTVKSKSKRNERRQERKQANQ